MSHHAPQPTPQQLQPLVEKHHATWKWLTNMMGISLAGILAVLVLLLVFVA